MMNEIDIEKVAAIVHDQWSHWMKYLFKQTCGERERYADLLDRERYFCLNKILSINFRPYDIERWKKQMETPYSELTEKEKESDREWAQKYIDLFKGN